jgi:tight adherence protein B
MGTLIVIIFLGVFAVVALLLIASGTGATQQTKQVLAALDSAIAVGGRGEMNDQMVDLRKSELLSAIPMLNRWLLQIEVAPRLHRLLNQANLKWTAGGLMSAMAICFVIPGYLIYLRTGVLLLSLGLGGVAGFAPLFFVLQKRGKRFGKFEQQLPEALELMVSALRVGHSLNAALGLVAREVQDPLGGEFRLCYDEQNYGLELRTAMDNLATRMPLQDLRIVVTAILIQKESGGNLAEVLDKVAHVIRERFRLKRQVMTHTAQGRLTGWILSALPVVLGVALYMINPDTMSLLWKREIGIKLLYLSGAMTVVGTLIINKIVNMEV